MLVLFFLQSIMYGSSPTAIDKLPGNYHLTSWTTDNGLPQNSINKIIQTRDGYIWMATFDGLVRFDGVKFTVFNPRNFPLLKSSRILDVSESRDGGLWIATEGGGGGVKRTQGQDTLDTKSHGVSQAFVYHIFPD
ncbi:MAG: hypothetical protein GY940_32370, partial [bacterium]|nr:hypothetical protein [bacterium]